MEYKRIIKQYRDKGVILWADENNLNFKAPKGSLTQDQLEYLKQNKIKLLYALKEEDKEAVKFQLTDIQSAYLLGRRDSFDYGGVSCQIYMEMEYPSLSKIKVNQAWNQLIQRHDMLKAVVYEEGYQQVLQEVLEYMVEFEEFELRCDEMEKTLQIIRKQKSAWTSTVNQWPFFHISVSHFADKAIMHMTFDFMIADWGSIWLLISEFEEFYKNPDLSREKPGFTFEEYLELENELKTGKKYADDRAYWMERIKKLPEKPRLPVLESTNAENKFERSYCQLSKEKWQKLKENALSFGCTPTSAVLTIYAMCLARWSRNQDFLLNLTLLNRLPLHKQVNQVVGDFTSVNLLEINIEKEIMFFEAVKKTQEKMFQDLDHRTFSGVSVLREITREKGKENALIPYVFTSSIGLVQAGNIEGRIGEFGISQTPQVFIDCQAMDNEEGLRINWDIRKGVFREDMLKDMFDAFQTALQEIANDLSTWEKKELIKLPKHQQDLRQKANDTQQEFIYESLHGAFVRQVKTKENQIAVIDEEGAVTYKELFHMALVIAKALKERDVRKGDKVAILIPKGRKQVAAVLGTLMLGAAYVPLDEKQPVNRMNIIINSTKIEHLLTLTAYEEMQICCNHRIYVDELNENEAGMDEEEICNCKKKDLAYIIFTSGSTGTPKGVQITHGGADNTIRDVNRRFQISEKDKVLSLSKLNFDLSVYDMFGLLSVGGAIVFGEEESYLNPAKWYELIQDNHVTIWNTVPSFMQMLLDYMDREKPGSLPLKVILLSGDWVPVDMPKSLHKYIEDAFVIALGGATEASIWSNYHICSKENNYEVSIPYGYPLANQKYRVLNCHREDCPDYVMGELYILGAGLAIGYFEDEQMNQNHFICDNKTKQSMYRTGDYGYYLPNGEIVFCGRMDEQVKLRGHRIELGEIEAVLRQHEAVSDACAVICGEKLQNLYAVAVCTKEIGEEALKAYAKDYLPAYMIPFGIKFILKIPLTPNGKTDRKKVRQEILAYIEESKKDAIQNTEMDELAKKLVHILEKYLGIVNFSYQANVYEYGADSLILAQYIGEVKELLKEVYPDREFSYDGLLRQILNIPYVDKLFDYIHETAVSKKNSILKNKYKENSKKNTGLFTKYGGGDTGLSRIVFHAGLGTMNCFRHLLKDLEKQELGTVYGVTIQNMKQYCQIEADSLIETIAQDYASQIRDLGMKKVQLIGYCMGGLIAFEVAKLLSETDVEVVDFALVDSAPVNHDIKPSIALELIFITNYYITVEQVYKNITNQELMEAIQFAFQNSNQSLCEESLWRLKESKQHFKAYQFFRELSEKSVDQRFSDYAAAIQEVVNEKVPVEMLIDNYKLYIHSFQASKVHPAEYFGDGRLLEAKEAMDFIFTNTEENKEFWRELFIGDLDIIPIDGNHITCIEDAKNAKQVAVLIAQPFM
jgi:pyochelin synthetase